MKTPWFLIVALIAFIGSFIIALLRQKKIKAAKPKSKNYKALANTAAIRNLPEYKAAQKKYRLLLIAAAALFIVAFAATAVVAARPISIGTKRPEYENRDIMLCLDVSGSMNSYIEQLLNYFSSLVDDFQGQRVGVTIFDGVYMPVAPLTDDYEMLSDLFTDIAENSNNYWTALWRSSANAGSSAIGPGLVGCINSFDRLDEERSRAIIFATDNYAQENQLVSLTQAANYAKRYDIAVYGLSTSDWRSQEEIDSNDYSWESDEPKEFRESMLLTGGAYYSFSAYGDGNIVVSDLVDKILEQAAARYEGAATLIETDMPLIPTLIALIALVIFFVLIWELSL